MVQTNEMQIEFDARSCNEGFVRVSVAAFCTQLNPTLEEVADIKTAVSEAITNAMIHGYGGEVHKIWVKCRIQGKEFCIDVIDHGVGIADIEKAMEPMFTTDPSGERSGMGFSFMEAFMDQVNVESEPGRGTSVFMIKYIGR